METTNGEEKRNATQSEQKKKRREREATTHKDEQKIETKERRFEAKTVKRK